MESAIRTDLKAIFPSLAREGLSDNSFFALSVSTQAVKTKGPFSSTEEIWQPRPQGQP